jgi:pimeloyl-ACP methyl ester carboxylesterase
VIPELSSERGQDVAEESLHLILLPGLDGTGRMFVPLLEVLPPSMRPHVISYPTDRPLGYDELADYVRARLPDRGRIVLLGESFSGPIAIRVAAEEPERMAGLILVCTFATPPIPAVARVAARLLARRAILSITPPRSLLRWWLLGWRAPASLVDQLRDAIAMVGPDVMARRIGEVLRVDVRGELASGMPPVLYLRARHDRVVSRRAVREIVEIVPSAEVGELDAPHMLLQRAPGEALAIIARFLMG